jgi:cytochrome c2
VRLPRNRIGLALATVVLALVATGCGTGGIVDASADQTQGKDLFKERCAACHVLADAQAQGRIGPDLDAVFGADYDQGFDESTVRQVVADQIRYAGDYGADGPTMPRDLVKGDDVDAVASYVAAVAGKGTSGGDGTAAGGGDTTPPPQGTTGQSTGGEDEGQGATAGGKEVFDENGCGSCHTFQPAGSNGTVGPDLDNLATFAQTAGKPVEEFTRESIVDPNAYTEKGFPEGIMPPFDNLSSEDLDALVEFLTSK